MDSLWRTNKEITDIYRRNVQTVYRVCTLFFRGSAADAEDAVQTTFLKLMRDRTVFSSAEHEKAWLIVTAGNVCKDMRSSGWSRRVEINEEALLRCHINLPTDETYQCVTALPDRLKAVIYLY